MLHMLCIVVLLLLQRRQQFSGQNTDAALTAIASRTLDTPEQPVKSNPAKLDSSESSSPLQAARQLQPAFLTAAGVVLFSTIVYYSILYCQFLKFVRPWRGWGQHPRLRARAAAECTGGPVALSLSLSLFLFSSLSLSLFLSLSLS